MYSTDIIQDIYNGNLESIKKTLSDTKDVHIYTINHLINASQNEEYRISLIPLLLKGEADHPGQFNKYKKIIDLLVAKSGIDIVMFSVQNPNFFKYDKSTGKIAYIKNQKLISPQMRTYLRHIQVRAEKQRKETNTLLHQLDEKTKSANSDVRAATQIVKRHIATQYRLLYPKSNER